MLSIAKQNDRFRKTIFYRPLRNGRLTLTPGVVAQPDEQLKNVARTIINQSEFDNGNDPYQEHDFGSVEYASVKAF